MRRDRPALRVIEGGLNRHFTVGKVTLRPCAQGGPLPAVEVVVVEQDTSMLLEEPQQPGLPPAPLRNEPLGLSTLSHMMLHYDVERPVGEIQLRRGKPDRLQMVLYDLNRHPSWDEAGVILALHNLFIRLPTLHYRSLAMPALAHRHGTLPVRRFISLLCRQLQIRPPRWQGEIHLLLPRGELPAAIAQLHALCAPRAPL